MNNYIFKNFIGFIAIIFVSSCSKNNNNPVNGVDVYVSGAYKNNAVYWKNGSMITLGHADGISERIAVKNNDVYIPATRIESDLYAHATSAYGIVVVNK